MQSLTVETVVCSACKCTALMSVVCLDAPGHGPFTWYRLPAGWWHLEPITEAVYRCPTCLQHNEERIPWPKPNETPKPIAPDKITDGSSNSTRRKKTSKRSVKRPRKTAAR